MRETELEMLQREKEAEHFKTWAEQEDNFHLHQAKLRSVCTQYTVYPFLIVQGVFVMVLFVCTLTVKLLPQTDH